MMTDMELYPSIPPHLNMSQIALYGLLEACFAMSIESKYYRLS
jgi:hypothetical protein